MSAHAGYNVEYVAGCTIVYGAIPMREFSNITSSAGKGSVIAPDIADLIGASFVFGTPENIARLRQMDLPVSKQRQADADQAQASSHPETVVKWLLKGERGASSIAMCSAFYGVPGDAGTSHPHDPDDLRRCLLYLNAVPPSDRRAAIDAMRGVSPEWEALVSRWNDLVAEFEAEPGERKTQTYELMRELLEPVRAD